MQINGGVRFCEQGMKASIRAMHVQSEILGMINENVAGFDKVGFQRREPVVSSFTEYIGVHVLHNREYQRLLRLNPKLFVFVKSNQALNLFCPLNLKL